MVTYLATFRDYLSRVVSKQLALLGLETQNPSLHWKDICFGDICLDRDSIVAHNWEDNPRDELG